MGTKKTFKNIAVTLAILLKTLNALLINIYSALPGCDCA